MRTAEVRRWGTTVLVAVLVSLGCVTAGVWQWHRHTARVEAIEVVRANYDAEPSSLEDVVRAGEPLPDAASWHPATVTGTYVGNPVLLRNRPVDGTPALHVLQGLRVGSGPLTGRVLVVDRGWVPAGAEQSDAPVPAAPAGEVDVVVRVRPAEPRSERDAPAGQVQAVAPEQVREAASAGADWPADADLGPVYGSLVSEDGARPDGIRALAPPSTSIGSHLSYTFQWWLFALGALAAPVFLYRRERRDAREDAERAAGRAVPAPARRRRPTAEEEEDALLDAQTRER